MNILRRMHNAIVANLDNPARAPLLDPRSRVIYCLLAVVVMLEVLYFAFSDFYLGVFALSSIYTMVWLAIGFAFYLRRRHFTRMALIFEAFALPAIAGGLAVIATTFLAAESYPFVDEALNAADRALGFDFPALLQIYRDNPDLTIASQRIYITFTLQSIAVPMLLAICGRAEKLWIYLTAWYLALFTAVAIFPFAPAAGPYVLHGVEEDVFGALQRFYPWKTGPAIEALRNGTMRDIGEAARGLVSIPSFHAIAGVLFIAATWQFKWLKWPMLALNILMICSVIITGSHYLIDAIAGVATALGAWWIGGRIVTRLGRVDRTLSPPVSAA